MPKLPDFSKLTKLDFKEIVSNVKSLLSPGSVIPENLEGDPIATKLILIRAATQNLQQLQEQQQDEVKKINQLIDSLFKDLEAAKKPVGPTTDNLQKTDELEKKDSEK